MLPWVVVGNPGTPRLEAFLTEARRQGLQVHVISWRELVARDCDLGRFPACDGPAWVRLESPGRDRAVQRALLELGMRARGDSSPLPPPEAVERGQLLHPRLTHDGFCALLSRLNEQLLPRPHLRCLADIGEVIEAFDKRATIERFRRLALPTPESCTFTSASHVTRSTRLWGWGAAYFKYNFGSAASGIVYLPDTTELGMGEGISTVLPRGGAFYNTRRLQTLRGQPLWEVIRFLFDQGLFAQQAIRRTRVDGMGFDLRVITVAGRPRFTVFRQSALPMTNLHLGGFRGDEAICRAAIPTRFWLDAMDLCGELAGGYQSLMLGIDLLFEAYTHQAYLLEVNAFGDFIPGYRDAAGKTIHQVEIEAVQARERGDECLP